MELAVRAAALAITAALAAALLIRPNAELALCLALGAGAVLLAAAAPLAGEIAASAERSRLLSGLSPAVYAPVLKCVAVGIICSIASGACRDAGSSVLADALDLAGAAAALYCALPLLTGVLDAVEALL